MNGKPLCADDTLSIDGSSGDVMEGAVADRSSPKLSGDFAKVMRWADKYRTLAVRTNADTPEDAKRAREFGAAGHRAVPHRAHVLRGRPHHGDAEMILADTEKAASALAKLLPYQRDDFIGIFKAMKGLPGDDPPAGPAAARVPAARAQGRSRSWPRALGVPAT